MADQKVTQLVEELSPALADLLYMVDDPAGAPISKKVTVQNVLDIFNFVGFHVVMDGDQTLVTGVGQVLEFDVETFDIGGYFNVANYRWTPPAGYVYVHLSVKFNQSTSLAHIAAIRVNGVSVHQTVNRPVTSAFAIHVVCTWVGYVDGDDFIEGFAAQYSGGNMDVEDDTHFMGFCIPQS